MSATDNTQNNSIDLSWLEQYRRITVIGLGMSGMGVIKKLTSHGLQLHVQDSRKNPAGIDELISNKYLQSIHTGSFDLDGILASDLLIMSPGVSLQTAEIQQAIIAGVEISSDVDIITRSSSVPIIAITGSNGKSTVTQLVGDLCQSSGYTTFVGGNIGRSVMELLDDNVEYEVAVLELSSFQLEVTPQLNALSSVILNLSPDHLDRYKDFQAYANSKLPVYKNSQRCVWNREDQVLQDVECFSVKKNVVSFGLQSPRNETEFGIIDEQGKRFFAQGQEKICPIQCCQLIGRHNHLNVLSALALLSDFDIKPSIVETVLKNFQGLEHRMQKVRELKGVCWVNDSKATNVGATISAIEGLQVPTVLIAGGQGKGAEFESLLPVLKCYVRRVYVFGEDALEMHAHWSEGVDVVLVDSLEVAVQKASEFSQSGDTVLLSPACASFDMFDNFASRGKYFIDLVNAL